MTVTALSIAGSDPSGGAGIQADLKTFSAYGVYGMNVITALTAQNTQGVSGVHCVPSGFVAQQLNALFDDIRVDAIKIGMLATVDNVQVVADILQSRADIPVVLDTVMLSTSGHSLLDDAAVLVLKKRLLPLATIITPNLPEAAYLLGEDIAQTRKAVERQGKALLRLGAKAVFMKGGHLLSDDSPDLLVSHTALRWFEGRRIATHNTHGTGCTLSSAIAAALANGETLQQAVQSAKVYLFGAIAAADTLHLGTGKGPTHHFHQLWM